MAYDFNSLTKQADEANNRDKFYTDFSDVDPNKLHQISELTEWMRTKAKGSDVREVIAQLFERSWLEGTKEGNANFEVAKARGRFPVLNDRLNNADRERTENAQKLAQKANKDEVTNVITPKGTLAYASLPTSGNQVGWYYYCPDGDGTHGAGNYVWNGTSWYFGGTGDEGYNLLKKDLTEIKDGYLLKNLVRDEFVQRADGTFKQYEGWKRSNYIKLKNKVLIVKSSGNTDYNAVYDESKNFLYAFAITEGINILYFTDVSSYVAFSGESRIVETMTIIDENTSPILFDGYNDLRLDKYTNSDVYVNKSTGQLGQYQGWRTTNLVNIANYNQLVFNGTNNSDYNAFYSSDGTFIQSFSINSGVCVVEKPDNAIWIRCSFDSDCDTILKNPSYCNNIDKPKLPNYYNGYMEKRNNELMNYLDLITNSISFVYITDLHLTDNAKKSSEMIDSIISNTCVNDVICGGDIIGSYGDEKTIKTTLNQYNNLYLKFNPYFTRGNHDCYNIPAENSEEGVLNDNTFVYNRLFRNFEDKVNIETGKTYYYFDKPQKKVRFIVIDTNEIMERIDSSGFGIKYSISQSQINWFIDTLKTCPSGYKIIISGHIPCTNNLKWSSDFTYCFYDIIEAYNNKATLVKRDTVNNIDINADFSSCNGSVILYISGHGHVDDSYKSDTGCVYCEVNSDAYINNGGSQFTREIGTITEQSLDVVTINLDNNAMYMFRYGAGEDKMFNN